MIGYVTLIQYWVDASDGFLLENPWAEISMEDRVTNVLNPQIREKPACRSGEQHSRMEMMQDT